MHRWASWYSLLHLAFEILHSFPYLPVNHYFHNDLTHILHDHC